MRGVGLPRIAQAALISWTILRAFVVSSPISASIQATWPEPPLLIQIIESAAIEKPASFFPLLTWISSQWKTKGPELDTQEKLYNETLKQIKMSGLFIDHGDIESLEMSVALKEASPMIEAFRVWYDTIDLKALLPNDQSNSAQCESWAHVHGLSFCDVSELQAYLLSKDDQPSTSKDYRDRPPPRILPFDHVSPSHSSLNVTTKVPIVILYASDDPRSFGPFHQTLLEASQASPMRAIYVFRWQVSSRHSSATSAKPSYLAGWAAGLDVKKSDYLTVDDRPVESHPNNLTHALPETELLSAEKNSGDAASHLTPLKVDDITKLGLKATHHVMASPKPLHTLRVLCQDFLKHAPTLVQEWVPGGIDRDLEKELSENALQGPIRPGLSGIWINGLDVSSSLPPSNLNMFKLITLMRQERWWMNSLIKMDLTPLQVRKIVADEALNIALTENGGVRSEGLEVAPTVLGERFDASDRKEGGTAILWLNDLEKDERYSAWPNSLRDFLRPTFPGQLHAVARNTITVILALDLTYTSNLRLLFEVVEPFIARSLPIRWGLIPLDNSGASEIQTVKKDTMLYILWHLFTYREPTIALNFLRQVIPTGSAELVDTREFVQNASAYLTAHPAIENKNSEVKDSQFDIWFQKSRSYITRLALCSGTGTPAGCMMINGKFFPVDNNLRINLQETAMLHIQFLQHQIYYGLLQGDDVDVSSYLYDLPGVYPSRNEFVFPSPSRPVQFANLIEAFEATKLGSCGVLFESNAPSQQINDNLPISSIWILGDLDSKTGAASVMASLEILASPSSELGIIRFGYVHLSNQLVKPKDDGLSDSLAQLVQSPPKSDSSLESVIAHLTRFGLKPSTPFPGSFSLSRVGVEPSPCDVQLQNVWEGSQSFANKLGVTLNDSALVINGRILNIPHGQALQASDIRMLIGYENQKRTIPIQLALAKVLGSDGFVAIQSKVPLIASAISFALVPSDETASEINNGQGRTNAYLSRNGDHSSVSYGNGESSIFDIAVILDPASELAQSWSPLLENLSSRSDISIKVWFNPQQRMENLAIKRFFRTSVYNRIQFDEEGSVVPPSVVFENMPTDVLLTLAIETPPAWLALPLESVHDLDNIVLSALGPAQHERGVEAIFQLEHIIIAGHAKELPSEVPPRGLQIVLKNVLTSYTVDTLIMANLGYFQFKATPGIFALTIRPGRSSELYSLESVVDIKKNALSQPNLESGDQDSHQFALTTFDGLVLYPRFRKRVGKEHEKLIQPVAASPDKVGAKEINKLVGQIKTLASGFLGSKSSDLDATKEKVAINVFTVASGLLYERMAYLMCVSVMRHTKSRVKFWFISNFLSPSFKRFIPHLARQYDFDYQLVTYRWPPWLRAQKEKQRVIWGYKILFLDVLFPLELDRVIFVDSDQIVRTDLQALVNLDLRGAPYAYAPMCNDRDETKGFRFWDTGYWKDSLQGRPYHISALYVVDLRVFRVVAAGDQLRQHYQALSADPSSLANLDQDLPNNMQAVLPIFTLDQSWLWCETWCSDEGLKTAKTIDLCNNPLTHEPKLTRARRLIPEWDVYDQEVAKLAQQVKDEMRSSSSHRKFNHVASSETHFKDEL